MKICVHCGNLFTVTKKYQQKRFCGHSCAFRNIFPNGNPSAMTPEAGKKSGDSRRRSGKSNGYVKRFNRHEHRVVAEEMLGRKLAPEEVVHHKDHNRGNNSPENLQVMKRNDHSRLHSGDILRVKKTHCQRGHPYDSFSSIGRQVCSICKREYDKEWKKLKRRELGLKKPGAKPGVIKKRNQKGKFV